MYSAAIWLSRARSRRVCASVTSIELVTPGLVAPLRLRHFVLGQRQAFLRGLHLRFGRPQAVDRQPHIQFDLLLDVARAGLFLAVLREAFRAPCVPAEPVEYRHLERDADVARGP